MSATSKRDLRTARPLWADSSGLGVPVHPLKQAISVDVCIIGAGISAAFVARELSRDHTVAILDRRPPLMGSTVASTAMLQWEIDLPLIELSKRIGDADAARAYRRSRRAVDDLKQIVAEDRIRCGLKAKGALYLAGDAYGHRALEAEGEARTVIGLTSRYLGPQALRETYGIERTGALVSDGSASADPAQLAAGLLRRAIADGARVYSPVEVLEVLGDPDGVSLMTDAGVAVRAKKIVFCCGYEFPKGIPTPGLAVASTWALASTPNARTPSWLRDMLVWEASDPYLYFRTSGDGRLIVGGEDEDDPVAHKDPGKLKRKCQTIADKLRHLVPHLEFEIDYSWAAAFGESTTGLPSIGPVPGLDHAWAVMGFGGNGITYSVIASQVVAAEIRGASDPDADLYRLEFSRARAGR